MYKIAPEGWPFIVVAALLTVAVYFVGKPWIAVLPFLLFLFIAYFFRDPERAIPDEKGIFVSPADGKIIGTKDTEEREYLKSGAKLISIFMSPLNVHVNRVPCDGRAELIKHTPGGFRAAYTDEASLANENITMVLNTDYGKVLVRQIAGFLARRVVCMVKAGDSVKRGQRYGIIKFGSRVDIFLPLDVEVRIIPGQKVRAGESVLAKSKR